MKILVVDDDKDIRNIIKIYVQSEGYEVIEAENGFQALKLLDDSFHLILLDIMLPDLDGFSICEKIRRKYDIPVIFISAKSEDIDKLAGFKFGADDYITKPFNPLELIARVNANVKRYIKSENTSIPNKDILTIENLSINISAHTVTIDNKNIHLTKTEFGILSYLAQNKGIVLNLEQIYTHVWGEESILNAESTVSVHIKKLREKIEIDIKHPKYIKTVWGIGYRID